MTLSLLTCFILVPLYVLSAAEPSKPNIVDILCDDHGYEDVHCQTPDRGNIATKTSKINWS